MVKDVNKRMQDQFMPESHVHGLTRLEKCSKESTWIPGLQVQSNGIFNTRICYAGYSI